MNVLRGIFLAAALTVAQPNLAHHRPAAFDGNAVVSDHGRVTHFDLRNPHVYSYMESVDDSGGVIAWTMSPAG